MGKEKILIKVAEEGDSLLNAAVDANQRRLLDAINTLEKKIVNLASDFQTSNGTLLGPRINMKLAQKAHAQITTLFDQIYGEEVRNVVGGFDSAAAYIQRSFRELDVAADFTSVDMDMIDTLKNNAWTNFDQFGTVARDRMVDSMYKSVIGGGSFADLVNEFKGAMTGHVDVRGRPMSQYATLYANDSLMNFHNSVHMKKAEDAGMKYFLYYGNLLRTSRDFCIVRVGKVYSKEEIDGWTFSWEGKSGPAYTNRGGYNCRHSWVAVRKNWIDDEEKFHDDVVASSGGNVEARRKAKTRLSSKVVNGKLHVNFPELNVSKVWNLPDQSDIEEIKRILAEAKAFASENGATFGQVKAVQKAMTNAGYRTRLVGPRPPKKKVIKPKPKKKVIRKVIKPRPKPTPPSPGPKPPPLGLTGKQQRRLTTLQDRLAGQKARVKEIVDKRALEGITEAEKLELTKLRKAIYGVEKQIDKLENIAGGIATSPRPVPTALVTPSQVKLTGNLKKDYEALDAAYNAVIQKLKRVSRWTIDESVIGEAISGSPHWLTSENTSISEAKELIREFKEAQVARRDAFNRWAATWKDPEKIRKAKNKITRDMLDFRTIGENEADDFLRRAITRRAEEGLEVYPLDLLGAMEDEGLTIRVQKYHISSDFQEVDRSFYRPGVSARERFVQAHWKDTPEVYAHEFGHAVDDFFSGYTRTRGGRMGGGWVDNEFVTAQDGENFKKWFRSHTTGGKGHFWNGDGEFWTGNWIRNYEGRIYDDLNDGTQWWAMNMQRYQGQRVGMRKQLKKLEKYVEVVENPKSHSHLEIEEALNRLVYDPERFYRARVDPYGTWKESHEKYPKLTAWIEERFNGDFMKQNLVDLQKRTGSSSFVNRITEKIKKVRDSLGFKGDVATRSAYEAALAELESEAGLAAEILKPSDALSAEVRAKMSVRQLKAYDSYVPSDLKSRRIAEAVEREIAAGLKADHIIGKRPFDMFLDNEFVEVKTFVQGRGQIRMRPSSKLKKTKFMQRYGVRGHTVLKDMRPNSPTYGKIFYRKGLGDFTVDTMTEVKDYAHLERLLKKGSKKVIKQPEAVAKVPKFKTLEKAEAYARKNLGVSELDFDDINPDAGNLMNKYLKGALEDLDVSPSRISFDKSLFMGRNKNVAALAMEDGSLYFNEKYFKTVEDVARVIEEQFANGQFSTSSLGHVLRHESAHLKYFNMGGTEATASKKLTKGMLNDLKAIGPRNLDRYVSRYAKKNQGEFYAEMYAKIMNGEQIHPAAKKVLDTIERSISRRAKRAIIEREAKGLAAELKMTAKEAKVFAPEIVAENKLIEAAPKVSSLTKAVKQHAMVVVQKVILGAHRGLNILEPPEKSFINDMRDAILTLQKMKVLSKFGLITGEARISMTGKQVKAVNKILKKNKELAMVRFKKAAAAKELVQEDSVVKDAVYRSDGWEDVIPDPDKTFSGVIYIAKDKGGADYFAQQYAKKRSELTAAEKKLENKYYASGEWAIPKSKKYYINLKNPATIKDLKGLKDKDGNIINAYRLTSVSNLTPEEVERLKELGFDGVKGTMDNVPGQVEYGVFSADQIIPVGG